MPSRNQLLCFSRQPQNDLWRMSLTYYGKWLSTESISERRLVASENLRKGEKLLFVPPSLGISADSFIKTILRWGFLDDDSLIDLPFTTTEHNYLGPSGLAEDDKAAISLKATELTLGLPVSRSPVYTEKIWMFPEAGTDCWLASSEIFQEEHKGNHLKVDLRSYTNYMEFSSALEKMFTTFTLGQCGSNRATWKDKLCETKLNDILYGKDYVLTYEDKDGDWMRAGDVPLEMFIVVCKKLKIMKGCNAIGLVRTGIKMGWQLFDDDHLLPFVTAAPRAMEKSKMRA
ncbi:hypothetical protein F2Q69_00050080 [Brassica cretica]|uniref:Auxin-responsive protein n=1 Tax=Brassica cretica TaxID=69181 RepID=A0A8S9Q4Q9_BRACR|nr:hypothetical protein F2Q69_00050080 [Brassica cretica]